MVRNENIKRGGLARQFGERLLAVTDDFDFVAVGLERERNRERDRALVLGEENIQGRIRLVWMFGGVQSGIVPIVISTVKRFVA